MEAAVLASLIGAGASAIGTGTSLIAQSNLNKKNREWNEEQSEINRIFQSEEAAKARDWNMDATKELMSMENEYNSANEQYKRLLQTGMNPATALSMISGNGNAAASGSVQGNPGPSGNMPTGADMYGAGNVAGILANGSNTIGQYLADMPMKQAEYNLKAEELIGKKIDNKMNQFIQEHQEEKYYKELEIMDSTLEQMKVNIEGDRIENEIKKYDLKKADLDLSIKINELAMSNMDKEAHQKFIDLDIRIKAAEAQLAETNSKYQETIIRTQIETMRAQQASLYANAALAGAQKEGVDLENQIRDFNVRHQDDRYSREVAEYDQRMKNYKTERTMSVVNGVVKGISDIGSLIWKFTPGGQIGTAIGSIGSGLQGANTSYKISGRNDGYYGGTEWNVSDY